MLGPPAQVSFQISDEVRLNWAATPSAAPMEPPGVRSADHQLDVLALAVIAPCDGVREMPCHNLLQRGADRNDSKSGGIHHEAAS
jgi:hypothetical protein